MIRERTRNISDIMIRVRTRKPEQNSVEIKDLNPYLLVFSNRKAEIDGNEAMSQIGVRQGTFIDGKHVSIVWGYQVKELERLGIPYKFFTRRSRESKEHGIELRKT